MQVIENIMIILRKYFMIPISLALQIKNSSIINFFIVVAATALEASAEQLEFQYSSKQITCSIWFNRNTKNSPHLQQQLTFINCTLTECSSFKLTGECKIDQKFRLDEKRCFLDCCHITEFDDQVCQNYAVERDEQKAQSDSAIIIILGSCLGAIILSTLIFALCYLKCFKNYQREMLREINDKGSEKNGKYFWRPYKFQNNQKCAKCDTSSAFIMLSCEHFFHLECLKEEEQWKCPKCNKSIIKIRVFCTTCCSYYAVLKVDSAQRLEEQIKESYQLHPEKCSQNTINGLNSDRKSIISTKY